MIGQHRKSRPGGHTWLMRWCAVVCVVPATVACAGIPPTNTGTPTSTRSDTATSGEQCGVPPTATPGQTTVIVRPAGDPHRFRVTAAAALPDGTVAFAREANVPEAGDEVEDRAPAVILLNTKGTCSELPPPVVDGRPVGKEALPLAADSSGFLYLWDRTAERLVRGVPGGAWETVALVPRQATTYRSLEVAVSGNGVVFIKTDAALYVAAEDDRMNLVAGADTILGDGVTYPDPGVGDLPRPADGGPLPLLTDVAVSATNEVFISTQSNILEIDQEGTLREAPGIESSDLLVDLHEQDGAVVGSRITGISLTATGELLVGDTGLQRILSFEQGRSKVIAERVAGLAPGQPVDSNSSYLFALEQGGSQLSLLGLDGG